MIRGYYNFKSVTFVSCLRIRTVDDGCTMRERVDLIRIDDFVRYVRAKERKKGGKKLKVEHRNLQNAPGIRWLVRDVVFFNLFDLTGAPRYAHRGWIQEHHRYIFRNTRNTCYRACTKETRICE